MADNGLINFFYGTVVGRGILYCMLKAGLPKAMAAFLHSPFSKPMISNYIEKYGIAMKDYTDEEYNCFADFFIRQKKEHSYDSDTSHLISPCDGLISSFPICKDSCFGIKGSEYRICDLTGNEELSRCFNGGTCLIFRLRAQDYHRYCFIDSGYVHKNRFFEGQLHSVQPIACTHYPVYRLNRRCCTVIDTDNFGRVAQIEVGAMAVGGIVNELENCRVSRGEEMGRFELCGSTIVMLFEKDKIRLSEDLEALLSNGSEAPVKYGVQIGFTIRPDKHTS